MRTSTRITLTLAALLLATAPAVAGPGPRGGGQGGSGGPGRSPERREQMLRRAHTLMVMELAERLGFDSTATIKLAERLKRFEDQRVTLRLENFAATRELRAINDGGTGDAVALVKKVAANRVKLAQVDEAELAEILQVVPAAQAAQVALFAAEFSNRLERMARDAARDRLERRRGSPDDEPDGP